VLRIARTTSLIRRSSPLSSAHSLPSRQVGLAEAGSSAASQPGLSVIDERGRPERAQPLGQATARPARPPHPPGDEHVRTGGPADPRGQDHQGGHLPPAWRIHGRHRRPVRARSLLSLMVLSVLMACPGLRYCLMRECLESTWTDGVDPTGEHPGPEPARGGPPATGTDLAAEDERDLLADGRRRGCHGSPPRRRPSRPGAGRAPGSGRARPGGPRCHSRSPRPGHHRSGDAPRRASHLHTRAP